MKDWNSSNDFQQMNEFVKYLKTTDECAERGVKLISDFAHYITKNETEKQQLLQVVQAHRSFHPGQSKANFLEKESNLFKV